MGAGNVKEVFVRWANLPHAPFRLLAYMALTAKDDADPPMFYQGQEAMAMAMGMDPDADTKARQSAFRALRYNVAALETAGAIKRTALAGPGRNAEYQLQLSIDRRKLSIRQTEEAGLPPSGDDRRKKSAPNGGSSTTQRRKKYTSSAEGHLPPEEDRTTGLKNRSEVETAVDGFPARVGARSRETKTTRCRRCKAVHTGQTCDQYRNGDDMTEGAP